MNPGETGVKARRPYNSTRRQAEARRNQERVIDASERRYLTDGYAQTTIASIAEDAGVSVDTIYKSFGGKAGLVRALHQRALQGQGPVPAEERSDRLQSAESDPHKIIAAWGRFTTEIAPRVAPIALLVRAAAASDPELQELLAEIDADRLRRMTVNARRLHDAGHLKRGMTVAQAAEILWTYSSPELYELLVLRRRMPLARYGRFVADAMAAALLPDDAA